MGNKVVVTRVPRLKLVKASEYLVGYNVGKYAIEADGTAIVVGPDQNAFYIEGRRQHSHLWGSYDLIYPMDTFEEVAKWVAGGRKLADLQGDSKGELRVVGLLPEGTACTINDEVWMTGKHCGPGVGKRTLHYIRLNDGYNGSVEANVLVWPLGPGDTITITAQP